jgi:hypothetical protein
MANFVFAQLIDNWTESTGFALEPQYGEDFIKKYAAFAEQQVPARGFPYMKEWKITQIKDVEPDFAKTDEIILRINTDWGGVVEDKRKISLRTLKMMASYANCVNAISARGDVCWDFVSSAVTSDLFRGQTKTPEIFASLLQQRENYRPFQKLDPLGTCVALFAETPPSQASTRSIISPIAHSFILASNDRDNALFASKHGTEWPLTLHTAAEAKLHYETPHSKILAVSDQQSLLRLAEETAEIERLSFY